MRLSSNQTLYLLNYIGLNVLFSAQIGLYVNCGLFAHYFFFWVLNIFSPLHLRVKSYEANLLDMR